MLGEYAEPEARWDGGAKVVLHSSRDTCRRALSSPSVRSLRDRPPPPPLGKASLGDETYLGLLGEETYLGLLGEETYLASLGRRHS